MSHRIAVIATAAVFSFGASISAASAEVADSATHCVVEIVDQRKNGEFVLTDPSCFDDLEDAMNQAGLGTGLDTVDEIQAAVAASSVTIGIHYDGANYTGASISVVGGICNGGHANMSPSWDNRISSTISLVCGRIRHWTGANKTGSAQDTLPNGNLSSPVNNQVSSIQYLAS